MNEETRSYNEILAENKRLRSRRYQTAGQPVEVDVEFGLFEYAFMAGVKCRAHTPGRIFVEIEIPKAIAAWKAQQGGGNE